MAEKYPIKKSYDFRTDQNGNILSDGTGDPTNDLTPASGTGTGYGSVTETGTGSGTGTGTGSGSGSGVVPGTGTGTGTGTGNDTGSGIGKTNYGVSTYAVKPKEPSAPDQIKGALPDPFFADGRPTNPPIPTGSGAVIDQGTGTSVRSSLRLYSDGIKIPGNFPDAYQNSRNEEVPDNQKCSNCKLFDEKNSYCANWKATARDEYWCQYYVSLVDKTVSDPGLPFEINGYYPLYNTPKEAVAASPTPAEIRTDEDTVGYHIHILNGVAYYMPNGLVPDITQFHGTYPSQTTNDNYSIDGGSFGEEPTPEPKSSTRRSSGGGSGYSTNNGKGY